MGLSKQLRVWQKSSPLSVLLECRGLSEALLFESDVVAVLSQSEAENIRKLYTKHTDTYCCLGVLRIYFGEHFHLSDAYCTLPTCAEAVFIDILRRQPRWTLSIRRHELRLNWKSAEFGNLSCQCRDVISSE
eukprot:m.30383 g.30383  ORF g.30383 m.30383 type:complete len:132 (+) comp31341_c0_seq4:2-397(+)